MTIAVLLVAAMVVVGILVVVLPDLVTTYRRYRGTMLVTCPENREPAAVRVDTRHAAFSATVGRLELRLHECSRWPERRDCGQRCVKELAAAPEDCLVRAIVERWFVGRKCALCGTRFGAIESWGHQVGLLGPDGVTKEWGEVQSETLPQLLATHQAVCWNCHVAETFRRTHPELVTERPPHATTTGRGGGRG